MDTPWAESLLNRLLNEMDGLREDARITFILTTNRPEGLERALTARPGRIDQAIEFPLPDEESRRRLIELYSGGISISQAVIHHTASKTDKMSPAFIKELMRKAAQYYIEDNHPPQLTLDHIDHALEDMLFSGGRLNVKLLGGDISAIE
jgi:ATP-dependent 26S proteasome regulatory subunit